MEVRQPTLPNHHFVLYATDYAQHNYVIIYFLKIQIMNEFLLELIFCFGMEASGHEQCYSSSAMQSYHGKQNHPHYYCDQICWSSDCRAWGVCWSLLEAEEAFANPSMDDAA